jgi:hypothetical protein
MMYTVRPLSDLTGFQDGRTESAFTTNWSAALQLLDRELQVLKARDVVLELDVREDQIRLDGGLRGGSRPASGRVRLAFDSKYGQLAYATNRFWRPSGTRYKMREDYQHNVYAIAKGLEALRLVDRYGVTSGQQYTGFKALPSGTALPASHMTSDEAWAILGSFGDRTVAEQRADGDVQAQYRRARAFAHPDRHDGDRKLWDQVEQAGRVLGVTR